MSTPVKVSVSLELPGAPGLAFQTIPLVFSGQYDHKMESELVFPASAGSTSIPFGSIPVTGAKCVILYYEADTASLPILITVNGGTEPIQMTQGGFYVYVAPSPTDGITSLSVSYTGAGRLRAWLLA
jgi:hypothetical protein